MSRHTIFQHVKSGQGEKYEIIAAGRGVSTVTTFTLASETALAYEQDKTYKLQFCIPMIIMGIFGAMNMAIWSGGAKNAGGWYPQRGCG